MAYISTRTIGFVGGDAPWGIVRGGFFEAAAQAAVLGDLLVVGNGGVPELRLLRRDRTVEGILRWDGSSQPVTGTELQVYRDMWLTDFDGPERVMMEKQFDATPVADRFPVFDDLRVDRDSRLWIRAFSRPGADSHPWWVIDFSRQVVRTISLPLTMEWKDANGEQLLVVERDDLDVEYVRVYNMLTCGL